VAVGEQDAFGRSCAVSSASAQNVPPPVVASSPCRRHVLAREASGAMTSSPNSASVSGGAKSQNQV